ncbi:hypothetical protein M0813_25142 [Anaeramoeba flamelloides]|uniref:Uncharacterized protein n=1 Tax=Anaeramoeba flamelloides TaxID=1746091 RepID=A0ABQ8Y361_9EUKA|nr:hypothetical protein M0813_25142 [Anaeramoeba flamelloides]
MTNNSDQIMDLTVDLSRFRKVEMEKITTSQEFKKVNWKKNNFHENVQTLKALRDTVEGKRDLVNFFNLHFNKRVKKEEKKKVKKKIKCFLNNNIELSEVVNQKINVSKPNPKLKKGATQQNKQKKSDQTEKGNNFFF